MLACLILGLRVTHMAGAYTAKENLTKQCQILTLYLEGTALKENLDEYDEFKETVTNFDFLLRG